MRILMRASPLALTKFFTIIFVIQLNRSLQNSSGSIVSLKETEGLTAKRHRIKYEDNCKFQFISYCILSCWPVRFLQFSTPLKRRFMYLKIIYGYLNNYFCYKYIHIVCSNKKLHFKWKGTMWISSDDLWLSVVLT